MIRRLPALLVGGLLVLGLLLPSGATERLGTLAASRPQEAIPGAAGEDARGPRGGPPREVVKPRKAQALGPRASSLPHRATPRKPKVRPKPRPKAKFSYTPWSPPPVLLPVRPGDRLGGFPAGTARAILVWAEWSRPSVLEKQLLEEVTASGSAAASRVQVVTLDLDDPESARPIGMLGGAPALPILYLVSADGIVRRRYVGWPARNPEGVRTVLIRELTALAAR